MIEQRLAGGRIRRVAEVTDDQDWPLFEPFPLGVARIAATTTPIRQMFVERPADLAQSRETGVARRQSDALHLRGVTANACADFVVKNFQDAEQFGDFRFQRRDLFFRHAHGCQTSSQAAVTL
jgi:hypothetical protein